MNVRAPLFYRRVAVLSQPAPGGIVARDDQKQGIPFAPRWYSPGWHLGNAIHPAHNHAKQVPGFGEQLMGMRDSDISGEDDFPFYDGRPVRLRGGQWAVVMLGVALGFAALVAPIPGFAGGLGAFIPALLFVAIPLAAVGLVAPTHWTALFRKVALRDLGWMFLFALLNLVVTLLIGAVVLKVHGAHANPAFAMIADQDAASRLLFFLRTLPQLLGEEIVTILPLLALMAFFHSRLRLSRLTAITLAWLVSAALFGALHLPTYGWDFIQCFVVIGAARLILSLAYLKTRNLWVSTGAHVINDWVLFGMGLLGASTR